MGAGPTAERGGAAEMEEDQSWERVMWLGVKCQDTSSRGGLCPSFYSRGLHSVDHGDDDDPVQVERLRAPSRAQDEN